jgi:TolB-like protein/class 3 adenylate cyclase/tetratricopeptide (TPR) repeat protein
MTTTRRLAAILAADVAGYSRLMGADELGTLEALKAYRREVVDPAIAAHHGRIVKTTGDGLLVEFASAVDAVTCAMSVQEKMAERGGQIQFRIGINIGDIISEGDDIFGDGVNVAARVENECEPGGVYLSGSAHEQVTGKTKFAFEDLGERTLKNIARSVRLYAAHVGQVANPASIAPTADGKPLPLPDKPSIAVLPFQNMSGDPEQEYFADGIVEEIITALARFKSLFVIARNSSFIYKGKAVDIKRVGHELGVRYVLEGSVRKAGARVRITGQLIEAATGTHLWADRFEGALDDIFELQDRITSTVVGIVARKIEHVEVERARRRPTANLRAYDLYLRAIDADNLRTREGSDEAVKLLSRTIELDPTFTAAMGKLCAVFSARAYQNWVTSSDNEVERATNLARRALEIEKEDAAVLCTAGFLLGSLTNEWQISIPVLDQAVQLNPNLAQAHICLGLMHAAGGEMRLAIENFSNAQRLNPYDQRESQSLLGLAVAHFFLDHDEEAVSWIEKALAGNARALSTRRWSIAIFASAGHLEKARETLGSLMKLSPQERISTTIQIHLRTLRAEEHKQKLLDGLRAAGFPE